MKKFFTSMLVFVAALGMTATAGEYIKCYVNGEEVNNGDRINITQFYEELSIEGYGVYQRQYNTHFVVVPTVGDELMATVDYTNNETPLSDDGLYGADLSLQFCGIDNSCRMISLGDSLTKTGDVEADQEIDMQLEVMITKFGSAADFPELAIKTEFTVTLQLDEDEMELTFYVDQSGINAGVDGIEVDNNEATTYFDLQGRRIENPTNGLYIVKKGDKVTKEFIR